MFTYNRVDMARAAFADTPAHTLGNVQAHIRLLAKLRFILGVIKKVTEVNGISRPARGARHACGTGDQVAMVEGLVDAEIARPETWPNGYIAQDRQAMYATMDWTTLTIHSSMNVSVELLGSHPFQQPADVSVFDNPVTSDLYSRFMLEESEDAIERYKLMRLAWDLVGTEFASRHTQYEMFYNGAQHVNRIRVWHFFRWEKIDAQVERALRSIGSYEELVGRGRSQHVLPLSSGGTAVTG